jgi:serine/threonine protein kinase/Tfp pilus assembly protein PilF
MSRREDDSIGLAPEAGAGGAKAAPPDFAAARSLKRQLLEELRASWRDGNPVPAEDLLPRWPGDPQRDPDIASILFEEFRQRREHSSSNGGSASLDDYERRFPSQRASLGSLFRQHEFLRSISGGSTEVTLGLSLPSAGDELFGFRLRQELGQGAFARVFLAEQAALAGRPVVVKVSPIEGEEPQTLAQLQHTHIVPIYSMHEDARVGVRAVCMPYFGGASLSRVLQAVWSETKAAVHGRQLVEALSVVGTPPLEGAEREARSAEREEKACAPRSALRAPALTLLAGLSYMQAAAWLLARLAEGLQHAHERGVLHCDIKPSNILLGADGQPMLLDFNLARRLYGDHPQAQATLGGTVAYMAPEHLRAMAARDPALARKVDQRTDVYALGMVLFEMLTGQRPFDQSASYSPMPALIEAMAVERSHAVPSLRRQRPDVPWGLESICRKCLAPNPAHRYQRAEDLAEDLRRFQDNRPLRFAPELSWRERGRKWVRRHPRLAVGGAVSAVAGAVLLAGAAIFAGLRAEWRAERVRAEAERQAQARRLETARDAEARQRRQQFKAGALQALCLVNTTADGHDNAGEGLRVCEQTLALYGILSDADWQSHPDWQRLPAAERQRLAEDVRELLLLLARARVETAAQEVFQERNAPSQSAGVARPESSKGVGTVHPRPSKTQGVPPRNIISTKEGRNGIAGFLAAGLSSLSETAPLGWLTTWQATKGVWGPKAAALRTVRRRALRQALALLKRGEAIPGLPPSPALWADRASYLEQLDDSAGARRAHRRSEQLPPIGARDHYLLATTYAGRGDYRRAVAELNQALQTNPRHYWSWCQRGICYQEQGEYALALADFSACVALWPEFAWGYFNRGRILHQLGKPADALRDYTAALERDRGLACAYLNRALVYLDLSRHAEALADFDTAAQRGMDSVVVHAGRGIALEYLSRPKEADAAFAQAWQRDPDHVPMLLGYGFAVARRLPPQARTAFQKVLVREPRNPRALYGMGMLYSDRSPRSQYALLFFNRAVEAEPTFVAARRARALVLAHRAEGALARQEIDWCVAADPAGVTLYAAACVYALSAEKTYSSVEAKWTADRAIALLREALAQGYGKDRAATDPDLKGIRRHREFQKMIGGR